MPRHYAFRIVLDLRHGMVIVLSVIFVLFVPAMQSSLGYGFGTLVALVILSYVFFITAAAAFSEA